MQTADSIGVRPLALCLLGMVFASEVASAQLPNGGGPGPVLGIVEIPELFFIDPDKGDYAPRRVLTIYSRPDSRSKAIAEILSPHAIDDAEYAYEEAGALVYGQSQGYFLIRTSRGVGWISPDDAGTFHPLETLIASELAFLTDAWDGFIIASPGSARRTRVVMPKRVDGYTSKDVRVKRLRTVNGKLWLEINIMSHDVCKSDTAPKVIAHGWIRAHDASGAPTVWFPSRGC
jgi:hypothetical protein